MLRGRLGLETARVPHVDRHGLVWLDRGELCVIDGCLNFVRGQPPQQVCDQIAHQSVSMILLGPGSSVTHDALRLMARHGTLLAAVGVDGVRCYTAAPLPPDQSRVARAQAAAWADPKRRLDTARKMYAWRLGEVLPHREIETLRGIEGARMKRTYQIQADLHGVQWRGRHYDRSDPGADDIPNQAINHAATAVQAAAALAVAATCALPSLGFIHEDSGQSFALDIADLFRDTVTLPVAFGAARQALDGDGRSIDSLVRRKAAAAFRRESIVPAMIDRIKALFDLAD